MKVSGNEVQLTELVKRSRIEKKIYTNGLNYIRKQVDPFPLIYRKFVSSEILSKGGDAKDQNATKYVFFPEASKLVFILFSAFSDNMFMLHIFRRTNELKTYIDIPDDIIMKFKEFWLEYKDTPLKGTEL